ncbi:hypothetical protein ACXYMX_06680 [Sporosarcina sp. CAU 1771]
MVRSLSFIHLFVVLAVGYIGGTLLYREMTIDAMEKLIVIFDGRVVYGHDVGAIRPILTTLLFFIVAFLFSLVRQLRFAVLIFGALKAAVFGLCSAYLLDKGMKILDYSIWWFPFQFMSSLLFLAYCAILNPPFFLGRTTRDKRNDRALLFVIALTIFVTISEMLVFYYLLK